MTSVLRAVFYISLAISLAKSAFSISQESAKEALYVSAKLFDKGHYEDAINKISTLNIRADLDNAEDMKLAFKIRAIAYTQTKDEEKARNTIRELFFLDPEYKFDPFVTPAEVCLLADEEKALITQKNKRLREIREEQLEIEAPVKSKPPDLFSAFLPFGLNHYVKNNKAKAHLYLAGETVGLLSNIGAYWWKHSYLQSFGLIKQPVTENRSRFQLAQTVQYIGIGLFALAYSISVLDALMSMKHQSLHQEL
jgi:tetratricopeptide (TPR) repeat protein